MSENTLSGGGSTWAAQGLYIWTSLHDKKSSLLTVSLLNGAEHLQTQHDKVQLEKLSTLKIRSSSVPAFHIVLKVIMYKLMLLLLDLTKDSFPLPIYALHLHILLELTPSNEKHENVLGCFSF